MVGMLLPGFIATATHRRARLPPPPLTHALLTALLVCCSSSPCAPPSSAAPGTPCCNTALARSAPAPPLALRPPPALSPTRPPCTVLICVVTCTLVTHSTLLQLQLHCGELTLTYLEATTTGCVCCQSPYIPDRSLK